MSGIDECLDDIPECPICGFKPSYWTIQDKDGPVLWLFSKVYMVQKNKDYGHSRHTRGEGYHKRLRESYVEFLGASCMGGCGNSIKVDDAPATFEMFYRLFEMYYPSKIQRTD